MYPKDKDQKNILEYMIGKTSGVDTREGSVVFDSLAPSSHLAAQLYIDMQLTQDSGLLDTTWGEYLTLLGKQNAIDRKEAVKCERKVIFSGIAPGTGTRFFTNDIYWILLDNGNVECEEAGTIGNEFSTGIFLIPDQSQAGLESSTLGDIVIPGSNEEEDEPLRERIRQKISDPQLNSNKSQVKFWCEEVEGIGLARILPLWNGPNTVKGILLNTDFQPASQQLVNEVQNLLDPGSQGLGEGLADIGCIFTAEAAGETKINVNATLELEKGFTAESVKKTFEKKLREYLINTAKEDTQEVSYNKIGAILISLDSVKDYSNFTINAGTVNVTIQNVNVAVVGDLNFS